MMGDYEFSTVKIVPHAARGESINVGILLYDRGTRLLHRRLTDNWDEVRRRAGVESLPDLGAAAESEPARVGDGCLESLAENSMGSLAITAPRPLMPFGTPRAALDWVFRSQVGVPDGGGGRAAGADSVLAGLVRGAEFPRGCCRRGHEFGNGRVSIRFPYVFARGGSPFAAMFAVSFSQERALAAIKQRLYDVVSIREWHGGGIEFAMFAAQERGEVDEARGDARNGLGMLAERGVGVVYADGIGGMLGRLRRMAA